MPFSNDEIIDEKNKSKFKTFILIVSIGVFLLSLFNTSYCNGKGECGISLGLFIIGWLGVFAGGAGLTWLANPLIIISWILIAKNIKYGWTVALLASLVSLSFLKFDTIIINEAGHYETIAKVGLGYWLWFSSCLITFVGSFRNAIFQVC